MDRPTAAPEMPLWDRYSVTADGRVISRKWRKPRALKAWQSGSAVSENKGYFTVALMRNGHKERWTIHRLMAVAFLPNPCNLPVVRHLDGDCHNNALDNLAWGTHSENALDAVAHGTMHNRRLLTSHCVRGHALDSTNLKIDKRGWRKCKVCERDRMRRSRAERNATVHGHALPNGVTAAAGAGLGASRPALAAETERAVI